MINPPPLQISSAQAQFFLELIHTAENIVIISHRNPDPDTIGSNLALREILTKLGKKTISACVDPVKASHLVPATIFQTTFDLNSTDLIIGVDAGSISQLGFTKNFPDLFERNIPVLNIDHHASNNLYGSYHIVFPEAASTTVVLYLLFQACGLQLTPTIATWLLYGLYYDTGSFMHSNTTAQVYEIGAELQQMGADFHTIVREVFHHHTLPKLKLWGKIFEEAELTSKNIVVAGITHEDLQKMQTSTADISGAIDYLSMVKGNTFAAILSEDGKGNIRGSIRTKENNVNLSEIAGIFGGGGHKKASGFTVPGKLQKETLWKIEEPK